MEFETRIARRAARCDSCKASHAVPASAKVDDVLAALQATAGALWSLEVLEPIGAKKCAALLDDEKKEMDLCGVAITELEETARNLAL
jgi:hypothetical protein